MHVVGAGSRGIVRVGQLQLHVLIAERVQPRREVGCSCQLAFEPFRDSGYGQDPL